MKRFKNLDDLYNTILPALKSKCHDLHIEKYVMIQENDIFEYLVSTKWSNSNNLDLAIIVDDILNVDGFDISEFLRKNNYYENLGARKEYE
mgnify:CR=1 FL=1